MHSIKYIIITIFIFFTILYPINSSAQNDKWTDKKILQEKIMLPGEPSIAVYKKNIYIVWNDWHSEFNSYICYRKSTDNGKTWSEKKIITPEENNIAIQPKIIAINNTIHLIWKDNRNGNPELYYKRSLDGGETWSNDTRLTYNNPRGKNIYDYQIKNFNNFIFIVWKDYRTGSSDIYIKKSLDNGITWTDSERITYDDAPSYNPDIAIDYPTIYLVWEAGGLNSKIAFKKSINENWTEKKIITYSGRAQTPRIANSEDNLYLVWVDNRDGNYEIYFKRSLDGGETWSNDTRLTHNNATSIEPQIAVYKDNIYVLWLDNRDGNYEIYFKRSLDGGETWSNDTRLTYDGTDSHDLLLTNQGKNIYLVWQNYYPGEGAEILFMKNNIKEPLIIFLNASKTNFSIPENITIFVKGIDNNYNNSQLKCFIKYKPRDIRGIYKTIEAQYIQNKDYWKATIHFDDTMKKGLYKIDAILVNPSELNNSATLYIYVNMGKKYSSPGFELILFIFAVLTLITLTNIRRIY